VLKGYADVHVVYAIVQALRRRGMDVVTAQDRDREEADDAELLAEALADQRVMVTNDADFLALAADYAARGETFAPIYFWPQQGRSIGEMIRRILREASLEDYQTACSRVHFL
jgi:NAD(P)-dependent dehydrogenase (short-subunit alcohol dehydrogenase family)